jgi:hypothetical protein
MTSKQIQIIRDTCAGYIGGKTVAENATDEEIEYIVIHKDLAAAAYHAAKNEERLAENVIKAVKKRQYIH